MNLKLPIGVQDFETLRSEGFVYIDKTQWLYQLITQGRVYFLSRPRRFGKSLLISTLDAIFQNKKHLFEGLSIASSDYSWQAYPVIWLDMGEILSKSPELLTKYLTQEVIRIAATYQCDLNPEDPPSVVLKNLIEHFAQQKQKVVVLVDEYDKPLLDQIHNLEIATQNREILKHFYGILKSQDAHIRFVLLTGVSKFSKVSVFSGLNNLNDISLSTKYASLLGYTQSELEHYFSARIDDLASAQQLSRTELLTKIKHWYNGYRFSKADTLVYNPFSTLLLFDHQEFATHWFATGTPTFLVNLIEEKKFNIAQIEDFKVAEADFALYEIDRLNVLPLLYQTGYLTIHSYNEAKNYYQLSYPNWEVETSFLESLLMKFSQVEEPPPRSFIFDMVDALEQKEFNQFFQILKSFLANIPYELHMQGERYYQNVFYFIFTLIGLRMGAEVRTNQGRIDAVIEWKENVYIFEFKLDKSAQEALRQIQKKKYAEKYTTEKKTIYLMGVNFSTEERNVQEWLIEKQ